MVDNEITKNISTEICEATSEKQSKTYRLYEKTVNGLEDFRKENNLATIDDAFQLLLMKARNKDIHENLSPYANAFASRIRNGIDLISAECIAFARQYDTADQQAKGQVMHEISDLQTKLESLRIDEKQARDTASEAERANQALREERQRMTAQIDDLQKTEDRMHDLERRNTVLEEALNSCRDQAAQCEQIRTENIQLRSELNVYKALLDKKS